MHYTASKLFGASSVSHRLCSSSVPILTKQLPLLSPSLHLTVTLEGRLRRRFHVTAALPQCDSWHERATGPSPSSEGRKQKGGVALDRESNYIPVLQATPSTVREDWWHMGLV